MTRKVPNIPRDFPVRPLLSPEYFTRAKDPVTCGTCGLSWDDAIATEYTPAPSPRCPFEAFHIQRKPKRAKVEQTKLAPRDLLALSKPALADLVWALAQSTDYASTVQAIVEAFKANDLGTSSAYANGRGKDGVSSDVLVMRKFGKTE